MYLKPTRRSSTTCAPKRRAMRVTSPVVTSVFTTIGEAGIRPCRANCASLKCVNRAAISLPVTNRQSGVRGQGSGAREAGPR